MSERPCTQCREIKADDAYAWPRGYRSSRCNPCLAELARLKRAARPPKPKRLTERDLTEKRCNVCGVVKPVENFYWNQRKWDQPCKPCRSLVEKAKRAADPETARAKARGKNARKSPEVKARERAHYREYYLANRERLLQQKHEFWLDNMDRLKEWHHANRPRQDPETSRAHRITGQANMTPEIKARKLAALGRAKLTEWAALTPEQRKERLANSNSESARDAMSRTLKGRRKSPEWVAKIAAGLRKTMRDPAFRQRMSKIQKKAAAGKPREYWLAHTAKARSLCTKSRNTSIELAVQAVLDTLSVSYTPQWRIDGYEVDFYIPDLRLAIECDGRWWHDRPERIVHDAKRDARIVALGHYVVRLRDDEIMSDANAAVLRALAIGHENIAT